MSILDALNRFAVNANAFGAAAANVLAGGIIDLRNRRNIGSGDPVYVAVDVNAGFTGGTVVHFEVVTSDDPALADGTTEVIGEAILPVATLTTGRRFGFYLRPALAPTGRRYVGLRTRTTGANSTAGRITASIVHQPDEGFFTYYPAVQPFA